MYIQLLMLYWRMQWHKLLVESYCTLEDLCTSGGCCEKFSESDFVHLTLGLAPSVEPITVEGEFHPPFTI